MFSNFSMPSRSISKMSCNFSGQNVLEFWKIRFLITTLDYHRGRLYQYETTLIFYGNIDLSSSSRHKELSLMGLVSHMEKGNVGKCVWCKLCFFEKIHYRLWTKGPWLRVGSNSKLEPQALPWTLNFQKEKSCYFPVHPLQSEYVNW